MTSDQVLSQIDTDENKGLTQFSVQERQKKYGKN